jgi:hypothetical protein
VRTAFVVLSVALGFTATGCKSKPKRKAPPPNVGSGAATGSGSGQMQAAPDLMLPHSAEGGPPKKTTKPLEKADFEKLDKLEYQGFTVEHRTLGDKVLEVRQKTKDHPRLWATVTIQPCLDCLPMDLAKWKEKEQDLKVVMGKLKDLPPYTGPGAANAGSGSAAPAGSAAATGSAGSAGSGGSADPTGRPPPPPSGVESEIGATELGGATVIYHYYVGFGTTQGEGGGETTFGDAYVAYYNDGVNQIRVLAEYKDDPASVENLKKLAPKEDLRAVALSFLDVYTHAWQ